MSLRTSGEDIDIMKGSYSVDRQSLNLYDDAKGACHKELDGRWTSGRIFDETSL